MLARLVVLLFGLHSIMSTTIFASTFVTHECAPSIILSPSLFSINDRRLMFVSGGSRVFTPRNRQSPSAVLVALLLLCGGVESNPGPSRSAAAAAQFVGRKNMKFGLLNTRSAVNKAALIHDFVHDENFDVVALTETWIAADAPDVDVAPPGYSVCHQPRRLSSGKSRGGGVAVICRESLKMSTAFDLSSADFESLAVNITTKSSTITVVCDRAL